MTAGTPSGPAGPDARGTDRRFEDEAQAADLSARMFWSPTPARSTAGIAVCSALLAILILYRADVPLARQPALPLGYALLLSASFLTALLTQAISVRMGIMYPRRAFLLALIGLIVAMPGVLLGALLPWPWSTLSMVGLATPVWIRHVTLVGTSRPRHLANLPVTLLQTVLLAAFLQPVRPLSAMEILVLANSVLGFLVGAYLFLAMVSGPMRRVYGIAPYELLVHGLEHFTRRGGLGAEAFFHSISSRARVWYGHIRIRRRSGDPIDIVSTALHPGPFGLYGGSDLPAKLRRSTGWARLMAFHGPCGHDMNPSRTEDVDRLARALLRGSDRIRYSRTATPPASAERGGVWIRGQCIGDALLVVCSRAPLPTDDLDYPTGMMALAAAKRATGRRVGLFVDAHNSLERGTGSILFGDDASFRAVDAAGALHLGPSSSFFRAGYGEESSVGFGGDIADAGVQALVLEMDGRRHGYILLDGNNLLRGHRDALLREIDGLLDTAEVLTTDNHVVNATIGGYRPIGVETPLDVLGHAVRLAVERAIADLDEAEAGGREGYLRDIPVLGYGTTPKLTAMVNATAGVTRWATVSSIALSVLLSLLPIVHLA